MSFVLHVFAEVCKQAGGKSSSSGEEKGTNTFVEGIREGSCFKHVISLKEG